MKKVILLSLLGFQTFIKAQSFQLFQLADSLPAANSYTFNIAANDPLFVYEFIVKNVSANTLSTKVRKTIISITTGQDILFCYGSTCYPPTTAVSTNAVSIAAGQQLPTGSGDYGIRTDFDNHGVVGSSTVKYSVFNTANSNDTAITYITYNVIATGINSYSKAFIQTTASPNPSSSSVHINYNIKGVSDNAKLKICNAIGSVVKTVSLQSSNTNVTIDVSDLQEGFYFYTLTTESGQSSTTKKIVIAR